MKNSNITAIIDSLESWVHISQKLVLYLIISTIKLVFIIILGMTTARFFFNTVKRIMIFHRVDVTLINFLSLLIRYSIILFTLIIALDNIGVQTAPIITIIGTAGLAIGLALQGFLANLAAGLLLIVLRPFRINEYIDLGGISGNVIDVQIFLTTLRTLDGRVVFIPNNKIITCNIINYSSEYIRLNEWVINVSYNSDIDQIKNLLTRVVNSDKRIIKDKNIVVRLNKLDISSISFIVRAWSKNSDLIEVYWDILENIKKKFDDNGIKFSSYIHK